MSFSRAPQGMISHHAQAIDMVNLRYARTDREDMRMLAKALAPVFHDGYEDAGTWFLSGGLMLVSLGLLKLVRAGVAGAVACRAALGANICSLLPSSARSQPFFGSTGFQESLHRHGVEVDVPSQFHQGVENTREHFLA